MPSRFRQTPGSIPRHILLDTNVIIDHLRGHESARALIKENSDFIVLSTINVAELYAGVRGNEDGEEQLLLKNFLSLYKCVPVSSNIARLGGLYRREFGRSHGVSLTDALIAATVTMIDADLLTLNIKHFPMFPNLEPPYIK